MRFNLVALGFVLLLSLLQSCDPPGKPKDRSNQEPNAGPSYDFAVLFAANCSGCHGAEGRYGGARTLNDPLYLAILPRDTLRKIVVYGRPGTQMPAWSMKKGGPLNDKQVDALVDGIYKNWAKPADYAGQTLPPYEGDPSKGDAKHGRLLFAKDCFMCHGKGAAVGPVTEASYESLVSNQYLRSSILAGRRDLGMPSYKNLNMGRPLSDTDINDLVAYLASYRPADVTAQMEAAQTAGEVVSGTGQHEDNSGTGQVGPMTKGNEGSGMGPGSPRNNKDARAEGNKGKSSSSIGGVK